jgi:SSS family solute:Na+ symporter
MTTNLQNLDYIVILIYLVVLLYVGFYKGKDKKGDDDLFLGGRSLTWPLIGFSIFATNVSPNMLIGYYGVAYSTGIVVSNFEWMAWPFLLLLGMVFVPHYLGTKISTMPQFLEVRFGKRCHTFLSYYSLFAILFIWIGAALFAGGKIISQVVEVDFITAVVIIGGIATSYTAIGGLKAVVRTDVFQSVLIIVASIVLSIIAFNKIGGLDNLIAAVPEERWHLFRGSDSEYPWYTLVLGYPVVAVYYWCTDQTIVQRVLGAKNNREGQYGTVFTAALKVFMPFIFLFPGVMCYVLYPNLADPDQAYMTLVTKLLPSGVVGLIVAGLCAALVNTIASALNSFSTLFTLDVYNKAINKNATEKETKRVGQLFTVIPAILGIGIAIFYKSADKNLFDLIQGVASYLSPPLTTVFLLGVLWKRATSRAAELTLIGGGTICIILGILYVLKFPSEDFYPHFMLFTFYLFVGFLIFMIIASYLTTDKDNKALPTLKETYAMSGEASTKNIWWLWGIIAVVMVAIYIIFN